MHPEIIQVHTELGNRIGQASDSELDAVSIMNQAVNIPRNLCFFRRGGFGWHNHNRHICFSQSGHIGNMDLCAVIYPWQVWVYFQQHLTFVLQNSLQAV